MDGQFFVDSRLPFIAADVASVTLSTTDKALVPIANLPILGQNYFSYVGKAVRIKAFGRITTGATPGNGTFSLYLGSGADANGTILAASAAVALTASQTNLSWELELIARARALGATGSLLVTGRMLFNNAVLANTLQPLLFPASAPAAVTVDLTAASVLSPQFKRSGSTAETMQVHEFSFESLN